MANLVGVVSLQAICVAHGLVAARALGVTQMACHYVGHGGFDMILEPFRAYSPQLDLCRPYSTLRGAFPNSVLDAQADSDFS